MRQVNKLVVTGHGACQLDWQAAHRAIRVPIHVPGMLTPSQWQGCFHGGGSLLRPLRVSDSESDELSELECPRRPVPVSVRPMAAGAGALRGARRHRDSGSH
jgi:hypothetical protein